LCRVGWKISQGNRVEHPEKQKWYFANASFDFENHPWFANTNEGSGSEIGCFAARAGVYICAAGLKNENLRA